MDFSHIINDKEFEHYCKWVARENFGPNVFLYPMHDQKGIDIYWMENGMYFVIQCKQRSNPDAAELIRSLESDFKRAKEYFNNLQQFIFATTASLKSLVEKITRQNGTSESVMDVCNRLSHDEKVQVIPWSWDYLTERISESRFLSKYLLSREVGADLISDNFFELHQLNHEDKEDKIVKLEYYGGQDAIQWYGLLHNLDAPRIIYNKVFHSIFSAFQENKPVAAIIRGDGGSGKSVFLRRIALNLRNTYTVYWLDKNIEAFLDNELVYDIQRFPQSQYIIILDDWYRSIERTKNQSAAAELLHKVKDLPNTRLIIGDRKSKSKLYDDFVLSSNIYDLENNENLVLLTDIFEKMPQWKEIISTDELKDISKASLFICLFVFCYGEHYDKANLADKYKKIFKSDYKKLLDRSSQFEKGVANVLHLYGCIYSNYGVLLTPKTFIEWICFYNNCSIPPIYQEDNTRLFESPVLKKYLHLEYISKKKHGITSRLVFHHDTMAEKGWAHEHELIEIPFGDQAVNDLIYILRRNSQIVDLQYMYYRLATQPGEKGKTAAREYLKIDHPHKNSNAFCFCVELLKREEIAREKAIEFLGNTDKPHEYKEAFGKSIDLLKRDERGKAIARQKVIEFLENTDKPHEHKEAFGKSIDLLKGDEKGEVIAKKKAIEFLENTDKPHENYTSYCKSFALLKGDEKGEPIAKQKAIEFLKNTNNPHENYWAFCISLDLLKGDEKGELIAKKKAIEFLKSENAEKNHWAFCSSLSMLNIEAEEIAIEIIKNWKSKNWNIVFRSLYLIVETNRSNDLINDIVSEIIADKETDWFKYREILKIPLFTAQSWVTETEYLIANWREQTGFKRNNLFSITLSYKEMPNKLTEMAIGIIRNWSYELSSKSKHKAYFTRCLANINITGNQNLIEETIKICKEIQEFHKQQPLNLTPDLENWINIIAVIGELPQWTREKTIDNG